MKKKKWTKEQLKVLRKGWKDAKKYYGAFCVALGGIEVQMEGRLKINGIEFFWVDNEMVGIGVVDRDRRLVQREELEQR